MDAKTLSILGTALSALIAAIGYYAKLRHERLRTTRTVLYHLLEMRYQLATAQYMTGGFLSDYLAACKEVLGPENTQISSSEYEEIEKIGREHFRVFVVAQLEQLKDEVFKPYRDALEILAKDAPILAYRLKGKELFVAPTETSSRLLSLPAAMRMGVVDRDDSEKNALMDNLLEDIVRESTLEDINDAIRMVALDCGLLTYIQARILLWRSVHTKQSPAFTKMVDATLSKIIHQSSSQESSANHPSKVPSADSLKQVESSSTTRT